MYAVVKRFCFCMDLALGVKIIGFSFTVLAAILIALFSVPVFAQMYSLPVSTLMFYELMALTSAVQLVTGLLLIIGAFRNNTKLMRPWAVVSWCQNVILMVLALLGSLAFVLVSIYEEEELNFDIETAIFIVIYTVYALVMYYAASIVNSHCTELSTRRSPAIETLIEDPADCRLVLMF